MREGYTFIGWTGTNLDTPTVNVTIPAGSWGDRSYIANWQANKNTITLNAAGGTVENSSVTVEYDASYTLPVPSRYGYTFIGWHDGEELYQGGTWNNISDLTLTAKWDPTPYARQRRNGH